ncbi:Hypothetical_protein [Hexamita inflata]|uniref:Hypothetical_protein n=1 Tax=Hexamita inflata TaxID=28002 RepID=A0AA86TGB5_9EUKA|nr:Hypothetical protein HINF_LOCUS5444 [Hexamita inflata]CAI9964895.1 Hypothetical protein HINF_LOCUS52540 [Hexamita inflata]
MCCSKCHRYCYILICTCLMFISMFIAGVVFCVVAIPDSYYNYNNSYDSQYMTVGVNMCIIGFFGLLISCCVACMLCNKSSAYQNIAQDPERQVFMQVPQVMQYDNMGAYMK